MNIHWSANMVCWRIIRKRILKLVICQVQVAESENRARLSGALVFFCVSTTGSINPQLINSGASRTGNVRCGRQGSADTGQGAVRNWNYHEEWWSITILGPPLSWITRIINCHEFHVHSLLYLVGGLEHFLFFHILGISSSQRTTPSFFRGVGLNHQLGILWWTNSLQWKDPPFFMGKSTISMAIFNS